MYVKINRVNQYAKFYFINPKGKFLHCRARKNINIYLEIEKKNRDGLKYQRKDKHKMY